MDIHEYLKQDEKRSLVKISTSGSVDDGKSTLIGRMLYDSKSLFEDTIESVKKAAAGEIDLSLFTDGLRAEREQKITIDVAYRFFATPKRKYILADTPGHEQYTRNMATGASTADAALILMDAEKGVITQTKRHSFILSLLGVKHFIVVVNKMDLVGFSQDRFNEIRADFEKFAAKLNMPDVRFIPVSALQGDNVVHKSERMAWYTGRSVLDSLDNLYIEGDRNLVDARFPVQCVLRPSSNYRGFAGRMSSGVLRKGDEIVALPSMQKSTIKSIDHFDGEKQETFAGESVTITTTEEIDLSRGDMIVRPGNIPKMDDRFEAMLVWMSETPLRTDHFYHIKHGSRVTKVNVEDLRYAVDVNTMNRNEQESLTKNEIGRVHLQTTTPLFFDSYRKNRANGRFVLVDPSTNATLAAGMILDKTSADKLKPGNKNVVEETGYVTRFSREARLGHKVKTLWLTGLSGAGKSTIAKNLEKKLFEMGVPVYCLDGDNIRLGINKDLSFDVQSRKENIRRVAEIAKLMNDAGMFVITAFISPFAEDRALAKEVIGEKSFLEVFIDTPLEICEKRDRKGLYKKARSGEIKNFTGISSPFEAPTEADINIATADLDVDEATEALFNSLNLN